MSRRTHAESNADELRSENPRLASPFAFISARYLRWKKKYTYTYIFDKKFILIEHETEFS